MQIVPQDFVMLQNFKHQNTPFRAKNKFYFLGRGSAPASPARIPAKFAPMGGHPGDESVDVCSIDVRKAFLPIALLTFGAVYPQQLFLVIMSLFINAV